MTDKRFQFLKFAVVAFVVVELLSTAVIFIRNELFILGSYGFINDLIPSLIPALSLVYKTAYISIPSSVVLLAIIRYKEPIRFDKRRVTTVVGLIALGSFTYYLGCLVWYYDAINELEASQQGNWCGTPYLMRMSYINHLITPSLIISQLVFKFGAGWVWYSISKPGQSTQ